MFKRIKNNQKGVTLVELIVSFMLVSVTVIYFMQIMIVVRRIYKKSQNDTELFVNRTYAIKIFEACMKEHNDYLDCSNKFGIEYTIIQEKDPIKVNGLSGPELSLTKYEFKNNKDTFYIYR